MSLTKKSKFLNKRNNDSYIINQYTIPYNITSLRRYKHIDQLELQDGKTILASLGPMDLGIYPHNGLNTYVVTSSEENRIDIVAHKLYGAAALYWILCYVNNISDPLTLPVGKILFYPDIASLKQFPNPLS